MIPKSLKKFFNDVIKKGSWCEGLKLYLEETPIQFAQL